jgi:hypothetical protein
MQRGPSRWRLAAGAYKVAVIAVDRERGIGGGSLRGGWWTRRILERQGGEGGVAYMARRGVIPGEVHFAPARAVQVRYGDRMIIRDDGGDAGAAIRTPFGPVSVEED